MHGRVAWPVLCSRPGLQLGGSAGSWLPSAPLSAQRSAQAGASCCNAACAVDVHLWLTPTSAPVPPPCLAPFRGLRRRKGLRQRGRGLPSKYLWQRRARAHRIRRCATRAHLMYRCAWQGVLGAGGAERRVVLRVTLHSLCCIFLFL